MSEDNTNYPFEIIKVDEEKTAEINKYFTGPKSGFILVGPEKYFFCDGFRKEGPKIYNMKIRPTDTFVMTFPKSGTTWTQELVWLLGNDFDYEGAKAKTLSARFPFVDGTFFLKDEVFERHLAEKYGPDAKILGLLKTLQISPCEMLEQVPMNLKRYIKSHLPISLMPPSLLDTAKVIYVARDPRDVAVSFFYHFKLMQVMGFEDDFKKFWYFFINNLIDWTPYFANVKEAWAKRNHPNMLFLFYEELIKDLPACIRRVADFMGKSVTEEQMVRLCDHLSFENFKKNESVNFEELREFGVLSPGESFVRKGKAGGWRGHFDDEMTAQAQRWIDDNLRGTDLRFPTADGQ